MLGDYPLSYLLIPFAVIVLVATVFFFFNIFHIRRYAIKSPSTNLLILGYWASFLALIAVMVIVLSTFNWSELHSPSELIPEFNSGNALPLDL